MNEEQEQKTEMYRRKFVNLIGKGAAGVLGAGAGYLSNALNTESYDVDLDEGLTIKENGNSWSFNVGKIDNEEEPELPDYSVSTTFNGEDLGSTYFHDNNFDYVPDSEQITRDGDILATLYLEPKDEDTVRLGFKKGV